MSSVLAVSTKRSAKHARAPKIVDRRCQRRAPSSLNSLVSLNSRTAGSQGQRSVLPSRGEARPRRRTASSERLCRHRLQHPPTRLRAPGRLLTLRHVLVAQGVARIDKMAAGPTYRPVAAAGARRGREDAGRARRAPRRARTPRVVAEPAVVRLSAVSCRNRAVWPCRRPARRPRRAVQGRAARHRTQGPLGRRQVASGASCARPE